MELLNTCKQVWCTATPDYDSIQHRRQDTLEVDGGQCCFDMCRIWCILLILARNWRHIFNVGIPGEFFIDGNAKAFSSVHNVIVIGEVSDEFLFYSLGLLAWCPQQIYYDNTQLAVMEFHLRTIKNKHFNFVILGINFYLFIIRNRSI